MLKVMPALGNFGDSSICAVMLIASTGFVSSARNLRRNEFHCISKLFISQVIIPQVMFFEPIYITRGPQREPASSRLTYFILLAYTGTGVSQSQHRKKKSGEVLEKMQLNGPEE